MIFRSFKVRAALALLLLVVFYGFALSISLGLLGASVAMVMAGRFPVKILFVMVMVGGTILWSIIPRRTKFEPPGPELKKEEHPRLFQVIEEIALLMKQPMPSHVYAMPDVNAFVTQVGGWFGFGSHRVMGIGLGLLAADNVSQFRATVAHEFGHFAGGDTRLGALTYATRSAMVRTLSNLGDGWLTKPFEWMWKIYLRLTQAISRQQELVADEWSVRLVGKTAQITGLQQEAIHGAAFGVFVRNEVNPLVERGVAPENLFDGYRQFARSSSWGNLEGVLKKAVQGREVDPYDSHPGLEDRIAFAQNLSLPDQPMDEAPATSLLGEWQELEKAMSDWMLPPEAKRVSWDEVGEHFGKAPTESAYRWQVRNSAVNLAQSLQCLEDKRLAIQLLERALPRFIGANYNTLEETRRKMLATMVGSYVGVLLSNQGFVWRTSPGEPLLLVNDGRTFCPVKEVEEILEGKTSLSEWKDKLWAEGLTADDQLKVPEDIAQSVSKPLSEVWISSEGKRTEVKAHFGPMVWPQCCALCLGSADEQVQLRLALKGDTYATVIVPFCLVDQKDAAKAMKAKHYTATTDVLTFEIANADYAALMVKVNA